VTSRARAVVVAPAALAVVSWAVVPGGAHSPTSSRTPVVIERTTGNARGFAI